MNTKLVAKLLRIYSAEDGLNYNTGSRLTMKPLAGPMPQKSNPSARAAASKHRKSKKQPAPAA